MSTLPETCMIFVDDSNVWIEAQKFAASGNSHMPKLKDGDRDPRLRINIGRLVERLRKDRVQGPSFLYGSRPPPNDLVWKAWQRNKFETNIYDRAHGGKEKEVDNSMSADMSEKATELRMKAEFAAKHGDMEPLRRKNNTTFIIITGDRDMMPAVKKIVTKCNMRVELWAWESCMSKEYLKLGNQNGLLSVNYINWIFQEISFTAYSSTHNLNQPVVGGKTMVLWEFDTDIVRERFVCDQLLVLGHLFWTTRSETDAELFVEFPKVNDLDEIIRKARELQLEGVTILSWPEYRARSQNRPAGGVATSNVYELLLDDPDQQSASPTGTSQVATPSPESIKAKPGPKATQLPKEKPDNANTNTDGDGDDAHDDDGGWQTVVNQKDRGIRHRSTVNHNQNCPHGLKCKKKDECGYRHTDKERDLFRDNPDQHLGRWKTSLCKFAPHCTNGPKCSYAHSEQEARCPDCKQTGHFQGDQFKCHLKVKERSYRT